MPETTKTRICDRPGCGAAFTASDSQCYHVARGHYTHNYCSRRCYRLVKDGIHPPGTSYSDAALVAEMRDLEARSLPLVWPVPEFRAPTEAETASTAA